MKKLFALLLTIGVTGLVRLASAFTYQDTDLLLVFRKEGFNDVLCNLGNVSNYLGRAGGSVRSVTNWDFALVRTNFGGDLAGVRYVLMAVTPLEPPLRIWLGDAAPVDTPADETLSKFSGQRSKINAVGVQAVAHDSSPSPSLVLSATDPGSYSYIASAGGTLDVTTMGGAVPFPVEQDLPGRVRFFELQVSTANPKPAAVLVGSFTLNARGELSFAAEAPALALLVGTNSYAAFRPDLPGGSWVYVDAEPAAGSPVRATQRSLGYREVDYKSQVPATLFFSPVPPTTNSGVVTYDYTAQANKTNLVGFWVSKDVPVVIGPDGLAYITDGHHTTAGYLAASSLVRQLIPGLNRVILGHVVANYYDPTNGPQPVTDAWWTARAAENNALLYGPEGDLLTLPGEPNYTGLQPILPSVLPMPTTPSTLTTNGASAMTLSLYRSLTWGLADGIVVSATDSANKKIAGYKKSAPGSSVDINFVEFYWADFLRHRVLWDDTRSGSPFGSGRGDASVIAAPLSFFTAVANGIALARSEAYRDEYGRALWDYTNSALYPPTTVNWARASLSNGLAVATDTYHLYLRDDSTIVGDIAPSALCLKSNVLHIDTMAGLTVTNLLQNFRSVVINGGGTLKTSWKDSTVSNSTLQLPAGTGVVMFNGFLRGGAVQVAGGTLGGVGTINGSLTVQDGGTLAPGVSVGTLVVNGTLTLNGVTVMEINKTGSTLSNDRVSGIGTLIYGGTLTLVASGDALTAGDTFPLFQAARSTSAFTALNLPALGSGLAWDSSRLIVDGTLSVVSATVPPTLAAQPLTQTGDLGTTLTLLGGAVGTLPITYQWQYNGADLAGQTGSSLVLANLRETNQGPYLFVARNSAGAVTSAVAMVTVNQAPSAQAQALALAWNSPLNLTLGGSDPDGDVLTFTIVTPPAHGTLSGTAPNLTYTPVANYAGPDPFTYRVSDGRLSATAVISLTVRPGFTYTDTDLLLVFRKDGFNDLLFNLGSVSNYLGRLGGSILSVSNWNFNLVQGNFGGDLAGVKYVLMAVTPLEAPLRIWLSDAAPGNVPADETLSKYTGQRSKVNAVGTLATTYFNSSNQSLALPASDPGSYSFIASAGGTLDVATMGGAVPFPVEQDFPGSAALVELHVSTANPKPAATQVGLFTLSPSGQLTFAAAVPAPTIVQQPSGHAVECGGTVTLSALASGIEPLSYQWYRNTTTPVSGGTSPTLRLGGLVLGGGGDYTLVVTNLGGAVTSSVAVVTVADTTPPVLSLPGSLTAPRTSAGGAEVSFTATAVDGCAGPVAVSCVPASGSTFALGLTTVTCTASDGHGNSAAGSFAVTVVPGFTYTDTDLLLVFRKDGFNDVLFNLGNVSNYLGRASGSVLAVRNWNFNLVQANFGGNLTGVKYVLMAVTPLETPLRIWLSDAVPGTAPTDETLSKYTGQRGQVNAVGTLATTYFHSSNQSLVLPSSDPGSYSFIASAGGTLDVATMGGAVPFPVEQDFPGSAALFELHVSTANPKPAATQVGQFMLGPSGALTFTAGPPAPIILVGTNSYSGFRPDLAGGAWVYVDADPAAGSPVRATQRSLGYREVDYKSQVPATLFFSAVSATTNSGVVTYDYTAQANKTNLVGFWASKDVPVVIGPDGLAYITDGHHTTAGYLAAISPVRQMVPGLNRVILGHVVANYFDPLLGPQPVTDAWWTARVAENNALLYGPEGDLLTLPGEANYAGLQPILPSVLPMPTTPSTLTTNGATAMTPSLYRGLTWGLADGIVVSATDSANKKIAGYKKAAPGSSVDINFVEFYWADFLRHRIVWDETRTGSPYGSGQGDASVIAAPLSFFTAVANGIALARSEAYRDEYGRALWDYTNSALFPPTTVNWAQASLSNGLALATDTYHLYLRDDSTIAGDIAPSALSLNLLHIDALAGLTVTNLLQNFRTVVVNGGSTLKTSWKDTTVSNSTLQLPAGRGVVLFNGTLQGGVLQVAGGTLGGTGTINGSLLVQSGGTLAPGASLGTLTVSGPVTLNGTTVMEIQKTGSTLTNDRVTGVATLTYGGTLTLVASGDPLVAGDSFQLFDAARYTSAFTALNLPSLAGGLYWDSSRLIVDGTLSVGSATVPPIFAAQPLTQTVDVGTTLTLLGGAVGTLPMTYEWRFNGNPLANQTGASLTLPNIQEASQGQYLFVAQNSAGTVTSSVALVTVNRPPSAQAQSLALGWNSSLSLTLGGADPDGDSMVFTIVTPPAHGALSATAPALTYTPAANYAGPDSFTYRVSDGRLSVTAVISLTVRPGFTYTDTDLLLAFRKDGFSDVLFNLGNVSNYLGRAGGTTLLVSNWDLGLVQTTFGGNLAGVKYVLMATTLLEPPLRIWFSDAAPGTVPADETLSKYTGQRSKVNAVGTLATTYFHSSNQSLVLPASDPGSYSYIASAGGTLDVATMGGTVPFPVEQDFPGWATLFELRVNTANPKPAAALVGVFMLSASGQLTFAAGQPTPPPIAATDTLGAFQGTPATFGLAGLLANDSDPNGYALSVRAVAATSTAGGTVTVTNNVGVYTSPASFTGQDEFTYTLVNAQGATAIGQVLVSVQASNLPPVTIALPPRLLPNGHFHVGFAGLPGVTYVIQSASEVTGPWSTLTTLTGNTNGQFELEDPAPPTLPRRFYRAVGP